MDWLLISCIASFCVALVIGLVLIVFWFADKADDRDLDADTMTLWGEYRPRNER